jgi:hypothetical protein
LALVPLRPHSSARYAHFGSCGYSSDAVLGERLARLDRNGDRYDDLPLAEGRAKVRPTMIIIETSACTVRMDGEDLDHEEVLLVWQSVRDRVRAEAIEDAARPSRISGGSVAGFVIEQADEGLNDRLPGGGFG